MQNCVHVGTSLARGVRGKLCAITSTIHPMGSPASNLSPVMPAYNARNVPDIVNTEVRVNPQEDMCGTSTLYFWGKKRLCDRRNLMKEK